MLGPSVSLDSVLGMLTPMLSQLGAFGVAIVIVLWVMRIERAQAVVNAQQIGAMNLLLEKLKGVEAVAEVRDEAANRRFTILERSVGIAPAKHRL